jgi:hypothetical protein
MTSVLIRVRQWEITQTEDGEAEISTDPDYQVQGREFLVSSEKELKDKCRSDIAGAGLLRQSKQSTVWGWERRQAQE